MPTARPPRSEVGTHSRHDISTKNTEDSSLDRIGAFSDAVFAFAITMLILAIRIPHPTDADANKGLLTLLTQEWRSYLAFLLSFMLIGINWANHRVMLATFVRANHSLIWLNLLYLLLGVVFMPIPTAVLGAWMGSPDGQGVAAVFYGAAATLGGLAYTLLWWYGAYAAKLTSPAFSDAERRAHSIAWVPAPLVMAILTAIAFFNPPLGVAGFVVVIFLYVLPVPRLVALKQRRHEEQSNHSVRARR